MHFVGDDAKRGEQHKERAENKLHKRITQMEKRNLKRLRVAGTIADLVEYVERNNVGARSGKSVRDLRLYRRRTVTKVPRELDAILGLTRNRELVCSPIDLTIGETSVR